MVGPQIVALCAQLKNGKYFINNLEYGSFTLTSEGLIFVILILRRLLLSLFFSFSFFAFSDSLVARWFGVN